MSGSDIQNSIMQAIEIVVGNEISNTQYTTSHVGKVESCVGSDCIVELYGSKSECKLPTHLHNKVDKGDIVLVQDLYNNNVKRFIVCKIGETE